MKIRKFIQENAAWVFLVILSVMFSLLTPNFGTVKNMLTIVRQVCVNGISAVGLTMILISGGIDLSTGSQAAVSGMLCASLLVNAGMPAGLAIPIAILVNSLVFGLLNGLAIAYTNMPALIATLATMNIARGAAYLISDGYTIYGLPDSAKFIAQASVANIPFCAILLVVTLFLGWFILNKTTYGRMVFAIGANKEAARLSGIPVKAIQVSVYFIGSLFMGLSGIVMMSRLNSGVPEMGKDVYIEVLAACTIGGVSSAGGQGRIFGMLGGVLVMGVISNGMNVVGLSEYWQFVVKGAILMLAVAVDSYRAFHAQEKKSHTIRTSGDARKA